MTLAVNIAQSGSNNQTMRNRIINGAMVIDQRYAGGSVTPGTGTYTLDRWRAYQNVSGKFTVQQNAGGVTPPAGFTNYLGVTSTSAYSASGSDLFLVIQNIEGYNVADFAWGTANAQPVTLSFWVRSSLTGTFGGTMVNGAENRNYPFTYTISAANTWEYKTVTIPGDTTGTWVVNNGLGLEVNFGIGSGATFSGTAGAWAAGAKFTATGATSVVGTNGATWYITGVQLEEGTAASPFENRLYGTELQLCQRYYENSFNIGNVPGVSTSFTDSLHTTAFSDGNSPGTQWKVTKRVAPTVTLRAQGATTAGTAGNINGTVNATPVNVGISQVSYISLTSPAAGSYVRYTYEASAEI